MGLPGGELEKGAPVQYLWLGEQCAARFQFPLSQTACPNLAAPSKGLDQGAHKKTTSKQAQHKLYLNI